MSSSFGAGSQEPAPSPAPSPVREISAGGVVFHGTLVLVVKNGRGEWVFPKGKVEEGESLPQCALREVREETGIEARISSELGQTHYTYVSEFTGETVDKTVYWFIMEACGSEVALNREEGFSDGGFMSPEAAMELLTFDRELLKMALRERSVRGRDA